ncbi:hypothetical protein PR048_028130 [Dryococelus australis]|uniref:Uncharacterized protein n=1 Tax=Dryococelus australis TaxID=614101 RepID=A0ABQ9GIE2_9NEOP|nr:hypothetical protein PR048_028130 [Dryococelus australis]
MKGRGKWKIPEKTRRTAESSATIPTCKNPVTRPGTEPATTAPGATVAERLACSPLTKAIRVQSPAGSRGNHARRSRWSAGFLWELPFTPPFHSGAAPYSPQSPSSALKTSTLRAAQLSPLTHHYSSTT